MGDPLRPLLSKQTANMASTDHSGDARRVLLTRPSGVIRGGSVADRHMVQKANIRNIIFPWMTGYKVWWATTTVGAIFTALFAPFQVAFDDEPGTFKDAASFMEFCLTVLFIVDIVVNFHLAFYTNEVMVFERKKIFKAYFSGMFWVDIVGVFPFETLALLIADELGRNSNEALLFSLLRLLRFARLHRIRRLSHVLQYDGRVSLLWFTLLRNFGVVLVLTHFEACTMYFIARLHGFDENTWLGPNLQDLNIFQRYVTSLYLSIVTFCTVGYGDFSPVNSDEKIWGSIFMLVNIVVAAWIVGSVTLLIVKGDEKTGEYRDSLETLHQYGEMHQFDSPFLKKLKTQLKLEHHNREIADEQVLKNFPSAVRRKILRRLYLHPLMKTKLMTDVRQQFVDAFLALCRVEIFSPGEEIVERGSILSDLFLLVGGIAEITTGTHGYESEGRDVEEGSFDEETYDVDAHLGHSKLEAGDFIGEIGFFTESPQVDSVASLTVCKTLTMSQSTYKLLAQDHPGSAGKILQNLLTKVEEMKVPLPTTLPVLRAGSAFAHTDSDLEATEENGYGSLNGAFVRHHSLELSRKQESLAAVKDLVKMHMSKQLDDQTTRLLFAASRGDAATIALMCDQGFSPDNADYDQRTALMVAAMKGNSQVAKMLLVEYKANVNLTDMHGSTALLEAVKNGHETVSALLMEHGAELCMPESLAASVLCQAVFDGDTTLLKRLLRAGIEVNASDYDKRTAAHIAAAEGNVAAIKVLADCGADLSLEDRWRNTVQLEAERSNARSLLEYLQNKK